MPVSESTVHLMHHSAKVRRGFFATLKKNLSSSFFSSPQCINTDQPHVMVMLEQLRELQTGPGEAVGCLVRLGVVPDDAR